MGDVEPINGCQYMPILLPEQELVPLFGLALKLEPASEGQFHDFLGDSRRVQKPEPLSANVKHSVPVLLEVYHFVKCFFAQI